MAVGGICGSLFGGYALTNFQMATIFLLFSVLPTIQLFSCGFVTENPISSSHLPEFSTSNDTNVQNENVSDEDTDVPKPGTLMRKRSNKSSKRLLISDTSKMPGKDGSLPSQWFQSFKVAGYTLFKAFRRPVILRYKAKILDV